MVVPSTELTDPLMPVSLTASLHFPVEGAGALSVTTFAGGGGASLSVLATVRDTATQIPF
jgi:hypothetical protein